MTSRFSSVQVPPKTKSRNGCSTCKERKLKCDETKPACKKCLRRQLPCPGYQQVYKWLAKGQTGQKDFPEKSRKRFRKNQSQSDRRADSITVDLADASNLDGNDESVVDNLRDGTRGPTISGWATESHAYSLPDNMETCDINRDEMLFSASEEINMMDPSNWASQLDMELFARPLVYRTPVQLNSSSKPSTNNRTIDHMVGAGVEDDSEESSLALLRPAFRRANVRGLLKGFYGLPTAMPQPIFHQATNLVEYYFSTVSGIYSCFDSHLNPFKSFVGHMWTFSASMYYAIQSMAAAHLANDLPAMRKVGIELHRSASQHLSDELLKYYVPGSGDGQQALLVLLLLGLSSCWHRPGDLGLPYLRTARSLVLHHPAFNKTDKQSSGGPLQDLFEEAIVYWEMLTSFVASPAGIDTVHTDHDSSEDTTMLLNNPFAGHLTLDPVETHPHPWTGISPQSQMLLARVGRLVRRVRIERLTSDTPTPGARHFQAALHLEESLLSLEPDVRSSRTIIESGDSCTTPSHFVTMAQVTRDCGLLELYRAFPTLLERRLGPAAVQATATSSASVFDTFIDFGSDLIENGDLEKEDGNEAVVEPRKTRESFLTSFAIHILNRLRSIPDSSSVRANQLLLLLIPAAELRVPHGPDSLLQQISNINPFAPSSHNFDHEAISVCRMRSFARARLCQLAVQLPAQPVRIMIELLDEVWTRMDRHTRSNCSDNNDEDDVFWVDIMVEKGWHTVMG